MPRERERRWLVTEFNPTFPFVSDPRRIQQGYFETADAQSQLRVRVTDGQKAELTSKVGSGMDREESDPIIITAAGGKRLFAQSPFPIEKDRHPIKGWEVDFFKDPLGGIILAEYESPRAHRIAGLPSWIGRGFEVTSVLSNLHLARLAAQIHETGVDALEFLARRLRHSICRVAFTGGPGSGKSTVIAALKLLMPHARFLPEVATIVYAQLGAKPGTTRLTQERFQRTIYRTQKLFEDTSTQEAIDAQQRMIVCDRGSVDAVPYFEGGRTDFERAFRTTVEEEYKNYDRILWFGTPSRQVYEAHRADNPARHESYETAHVLGERVRDAWSSHRGFCVIPDADSMPEKIEDARRILESFLK